MSHAPCVLQTSGHWGGESLRQGEPGKVGNRFTGLGVWVVLLLGASAARAGDFETFDFSLRFPAAISRFASYADVAAMGNAQAASEWSSSINPASAAWPHAGRKYLNAFSPQATAVQFDAGTNLFVISEALTMDAGARGVFLPAAAQILSNHRQDRTGLGFGFSANYFQLQWGKLVAANTAVGVNLSATFSDTRLDRKRE